MSDAVSGEAPAWLSNADYSELTIDASSPNPVLTRAFRFLDEWPASYEEHQGRLVVLCNMHNSRRKMTVPWNSPRGWKLLAGHPVEVQYRTRSDGAFRYRAFRMVGCTTRMLLHVISDDARETAADKSVPPLALAATENDSATAVQPSRSVAWAPAGVDRTAFGSLAECEHEHSYGLAAIDKRAKRWPRSRGFKPDPYASEVTHLAVIDDTHDTRVSNSPNTNAGLSLDINFINSTYACEGLSPIGYSPVFGSSPMAASATGTALASLSAPSESMDQWSQTGGAVAARSGLKAWQLWSGEPDSPGAFARAVMAPEAPTDPDDAANTAFATETSNEGFAKMDCNSPNGSSLHAGHYTAFVTSFASPFAR